MRDPSAASDKSVSGPGYTQTPHAARRRHASCWARSRATATWCGASAARPRPRSIDPGDDPTRAATRARGHGHAAGRDPRHAHRRRPHRRRRRAGRRNRRRGLGAGRRGRGAPHRASRAAASRRAARPGAHGHRRRRDHGRGHRLRGASTCPATPRATSRSTRATRLFTGDLLFAGSVGRHDLAGGDWETLLASIRSLIERFPPETVVHPGHGPATTLGRELASNPFLRELRTEPQA